MFVPEPLVSDKPVAGGVLALAAVHAVAAGDHRGGNTDR